MDPRDPTRAALEEGRRLFNAGSFFEAHEVWEAAWLGEKGETRQLLQGLIQIAAGYHQAFDRARPRGCVRLLEAGRGRLPEGAGEAEGLAIEAFRDAVDASLEKARSWDRGESAGLSREDAPRLSLSKE